MRYKNQRVFLNDREAYRRFLKKTRGLSQVRHYNTPTFKHPSTADMSNFNTIGHVWTSSDKFYNLAAEYYSDPEMWWVIAFYNQKPTEFHLSPGDIVYIPTPLETVLYYIGY